MSEQHVIGQRTVWQHGGGQDVIGRDVIGHDVIGMGTLWHSAALGMVAVAASTHRHGVVLVDARVCNGPDGQRAVSGTLRNAGTVSLPRVRIELLLLDRDGRIVARSQARIGGLATGASCLVRSVALPVATTHFRFQRA